MSNKAQCQLGHKSVSRKIIPGECPKSVPECFTRVSHKSVLTSVCHKSVSEECQTTFGHVWPFRALLCIRVRLQGSFLCSVRGRNCYELPCSLGHSRGHLESLACPSYLFRPTSFHKPCMTRDWTVLVQSVVCLTLCRFVLVVSGEGSEGDLHPMFEGWWGLTEEMF